MTKKQEPYEAALRELIRGLTSSKDHHDVRTAAEAALFLLPPEDEGA
jgi:hypothetical protein